MTDVLTLGETMAAIRTTAPLRLGGPAQLSVAGAESTVAIGLARLGHRVGWIGVTGADEPGELIRRTLRAEGVDLSLARVDPAAPTGLILFEPRVADINRVSYYRSGSAGSRLRPSGTGAPRSSPAAPVPRVLHVTGITCALGAGPYAAVAAAVAGARAAGALVCLDVNHRQRLWSVAEAADALRPLLPSIDVVVASDDELAVLTDDADPVEGAARRRRPRGGGQARRGRGHQPQRRRQRAPAGPPGAGRRHRRRGRRVRGRSAVRARLDRLDGSARLERAVTTARSPSRPGATGRACPPGPNWRCSTSRPAPPCADPSGRPMLVS